MTAAVQTYSPKDAKLFIGGREMPWSSDAYVARLTYPEPRPFPPYGVISIGCSMSVTQVTVFKKARAKRASRIRKARRWPLIRRGSKCTNIRRACRSQRTQ